MKEKLFILSHFLGGKGGVNVASREVWIKTVFLLKWHSASFVFYYSSLRLTMSHMTNHSNTGPIFNYNHWLVKINQSETSIFTCEFSLMQRYQLIYTFHHRLLFPREQDVPKPEMLFSIYLDFISISVWQLPMKGPNILLISHTNPILPTTLLIKFM